MNLVGHSYVGLLVALYAMRYPAHVNRVVQIGPMEPIAGKQYPPELSNNDGLAGQIFAKPGELYRARTTESDEEMCRKAWAVLGSALRDRPGPFRKGQLRPLRIAERARLHDLLDQPDAAFHSEPAHR